MDKAGKEGKSWISGLYEYRVTPQSGSIALPLQLITQCTPGPDPGFSVGGGCGPVLGGFGLQHGHFSVKMYAKMKELGPVGGACTGHAPLDPPMHTQGERPTPSTKHLRSPGDVPDPTRTHEEAREQAEKELH